MVYLASIVIFASVLCCASLVQFKSFHFYLLFARLSGSSYFVIVFKYLVCFIRIFILPYCFRSIGWLFYLDLVFV